MQAEEMEDVQRFTERARRWVVQNIPPLDPSNQIGSDGEDQPEQIARARQLQRAIFDAGLAGIRYPQDYGGMGLTREHQLAWRGLMEDRDVAFMSAFKVSQAIVGPTLLDCGTEEQRKLHVPAILRGEEFWVQFLSEPSAGSDLASLLTRADRVDDSYLINGTKIWSTAADTADFAMVLARTDFDVAKHKGLSMFILPVHNVGVTIRPIQLSTGQADFCEEFLDDVLVPAENLVGQENDGWNVVMSLFQHERNMVGGNSLNDFEAPGVGDNAVRTEEQMVALARGVGKSNDPHTRQLIGEALVLDRLADHTIDRVNALVRKGGLPPAGASILKLMRSLSKYRIKELAVEIGGTEAVMKGADHEIGQHGHLWLVARAGSISGGTNEMQRNAISERVLGLPRDPPADANLTFRQALGQRRT
jgi:alkylation response protein AidB-like acyl-CoA dehydrogenase